MSQPANTYMAGEKRKTAILQAGAHIWRTEGAQAVTARAVGARLKMTHAGVLYHYKSSEALRNAVAEFAVRFGHTTIIRQLITSNHPAVAAMDQSTREGWLLRG